MRVLKNFVHENVHPVSGEANRLDTVGIEKLTSGIGWCDQVSRVFMQLAKKQGITTRLLFLRNKKGSSPHTIAEAWDGKRWILVDAAYDIDFANKNEKSASMTDAREDFDIVLKNPRIEAFASHNAWWNDTENLTMYVREPDYIITKVGAKLRLLRFLPEVLERFFIVAFQEMYIFKKRKEFSDDNEFLYFKARNYHLAGRARAAEKIYINILKEDGTAPPAVKTRFFLALLLRDEARIDEGQEVLTDLIRVNSSSHWLPYAYGLRSQLYNILGENEKAEADFVRVVASPDAYFRKVIEREENEKI